MPHAQPISRPCKYYLLHFRMYVEMYRCGVRSGIWFWVQTELRLQEIRTVSRPEPRWRQGVHRRWYVLLVACLLPHNAGLGTPACCTGVGTVTYVPGIGPPHTCWPHGWWRALHDVKDHISVTFFCLCHPIHVTHYSILPLVQLISCKILHHMYIWRLTHNFIGVCKPLWHETVRSLLAPGGIGPRKKNFDATVCSAK